mmetsp:Transcript_35037/g.57192  ORF Transcript_35037/g.57192 Transcript_35037/m.57192 type:complete len:126 (+) Transcript_35037:676-1053(+)
MGWLGFAGSVRVGVQSMAEDAELPSPPKFITFPSFGDTLKISHSAPGVVFSDVSSTHNSFQCSIAHVRTTRWRDAIRNQDRTRATHPNVGRIVLVFYSKHNREKNDELVAQMVRDFQSLNPCRGS